MDVSVLGPLVLVLGTHILAQAPVPAAQTPGTSLACEYLPSGPDLPEFGSPQAAYDPVSGDVTVVLHLIRHADLGKHPRYVLSTQNHEPVPMTVEGPVSEVDAVRRFGAAQALKGGEYWALRGKLPRPGSFAVYYDDVWSGTEAATGRACTSAFRRLVTTVSAGAQLSNERGPDGVLPFVRLRQPVSTDTLRSVNVPKPTGRRVLDPQTSIRTIVAFRAAWFRPLAAAEATTMLDTRRGFDVAVTTSGPEPATREIRYVLARGGGAGEFVPQWLTWAMGDAVAMNEQRSERASAGQDGSWTLRLGAGFGTFVTLHMRSRADGLIQIVDATR